VFVESSTRETGTDHIKVAIGLAILGEGKQISGQMLLAQFRIE
jgi:hypothetical protein